MSELPKQNTGLIPEFSQNIWLGGRIPYQVVLESGDWRPHVGVHEKQRDPVECKGCVSFSLTNNIEIQHDFKGIKINLSDRALAKVSDTQQNGNTFERVADAARKIGVLFEHQWPNLPKAFSWAEYYKPIPQELLSKAIKLDFNYEIAPHETNWAAALRRELKQCPLWVTWPQNPYHAVTLLAVPNDTDAYVQEHYDIPIKKVRVSDIAIAAKVVINKYISMNETKIVLSKDGKTVYKAVPVATDFENFKKQASVEGIIVPDQIPPASDL